MDLSLPLDEDHIKLAWLVGAELSDVCADLRSASDIPGSPPDVRPDSTTFHQKLDTAEIADESRRLHGWATGFFFAFFFLFFLFSTFFWTPGWLDDCAVAR